MAASEGQTASGSRVLAGLGSLGRATDLTLGDLKPYSALTVTALLSDEEYGAFPSRLAANPGLGALIRGGGGIRKIRVAVGGRGKRGGARLIYYWAVRRDLILLLYAYPKSVSADLTPKQAARLGKVVKQEFRNETEDV